MTLRASHLRQLNGNNSQKDSIELDRIVSRTDIDLSVFFICNNPFKSDKKLNSLCRLLLHRINLKLRL